MNSYNVGRGLRALPRVALAAAMAISIAACNTDKLVEVTDPEQLRPEDLTGLGPVPALVNGALRQFSGGYSGFGGDAFLSSSAVLSDEKSSGSIRHTDGKPCTVEFSNAVSIEACQSKK